MKSPGLTRALAQGAAKIFFAVLVVSAAVVSGFGVAGLLVYHQLDAGGSREKVQDKATKGPDRPLRGPSSPDRARKNGPDSAEYRQIAALPTDRSDYVFANNPSNWPAALPPTPADRGSVSDVPPAIDPSLGNLRSRGILRGGSEASAADTPILSDPGSHFIVDPASGRIVGIDGSAGAAQEAQTAPEIRVAEPVVSVSQTPPPEVRVASAVTVGGQTLFQGAPPRSTPAVTGAQDLPVRRAMPVDAPTASPGSFNARGFLADDDRPVLPAIPVSPSETRANRTVHIFQLPDGRQIVARD